MTYLVAGNMITMITTDLMYIFLAFAISAVMAIVLYSWVFKHVYYNGRSILGLRMEEQSSKSIRFGGVVLIPCVIVALCCSMVLMSKGENVAHSIKTSTLLLGCGVMSVYIVGLLKDFYGLPFMVRMSVQMLAAVTLPLCGLVFMDLSGFMNIGIMPFWLAYPFTVLVVMVIVNAVNAFDGFDGFLSLYAILCMICFGLCFYDSENMVYCLIAASMVGALIVFFFHSVFGSHTGKSKIEMGNSGSLTLGFSLAYLVLKFIIAEEASSFSSQERMLICISLLFVPCFDFARVLMERILHGDYPFSCDRRHIHHLLTQAGVFGRLALLSMLCIVLFFFFANILMASVGCTLTWIVMSDILAYSILIGVLKHNVRKFRSKVALLDNIQERFQQNALSAQKICILTPRFPVPENGGDVLRINNIARQLKREGYQLVLVTFEEDGSPQIFEAERIYDKVYAVHRGKLYGLWQSLLHLLSGRAMQCGYYYSGRYKRVLRHVIEKEKPDLFIAHLLRMMPYLDELQLHDRSIIEMTDALSKTYSLSSGSKGSGFLRHVYAIERHLIRRAEQYAMMYFPVNVLVSEADAEYLRTISNHKSSLVVHTNGVDVLPSVKKEYDPNKIVFVGNMRTLQNQDAVLSFVQDIFPRILKRIPEAKFCIVGAQPPPHIIDLACNNIIVTGFVDDLPDTICDAAVAVAPVRVAAGIQNKVLVAMGCGLPVVLTTLISRAIPELEDDRNCIIRDEAASIADSCIRLMTHPSERNAIAQAGYDLVNNHYGWEEKLKNYVTEH